MQMRLMTLIVLPRIQYPVFYFCSHRVTHLDGYNLPLT